MKNSNAIAEAKRLIEEYCRREFGDDATVDFSDLSKIPVAYTTTEDGQHEIQVYVNLIECGIDTFVDGEARACDWYESVEEMNEDVLPYLSFDELVCVDEELLVSLDNTLEDAKARSEAEDKTEGEKQIDDFERG